MEPDPYTDFVHRQTVRVDRTRELERFRHRLRWWALTVTVAMLVFTILMVAGELV